MVDLFNSWDTNQSGTVDKNEFRRGLVGLGYRGERAVLHEIFDALDGDGSGDIKQHRLIFAFITAMLAL